MARLALILAMSVDAVSAAVPVAASVRYRTTQIDGVNVFYREAGPVCGPVVLLLHGFPTSSHMFRNLIPILADRYRVIAPDYPGFGQSDSPDRGKFAYTFGRYADMVGFATSSTARWRRAPRE